VASWLQEAKQLASAHLTIVLVGNKSDLSNRRTVSYDEGERFANDHDLLFMEASAKTAQNVDEVMFYKSPVYITVPFGCNLHCNFVRL